MNNSSLDLSKTASYDYDLPNELIASYPLSTKTDAKLLVYNKQNKSIVHTTFKDILDYIPAKTHIFFNDTKVIKARIFGKKISGGKVELLFNKPFDNNRFVVFVKGRVKIGTTLYFDNNLTANVKQLLEDGSRVVEFYKDETRLHFASLINVLNEIGHIPLPHYLNREDEKSDESEYQTVFSKNYGAVAAPTASLHFDEKLMSDLKEKFQTHFLTLHVGAGTFKPVDCEDILQHPIHSEFFNIPNETKSVLDSDNKIMAVGTTVTRTIEYYNNTKQINGEANIFLNPFNLPKRVDYLLTNFHLPKSTLIMLVASFIGLDETLRIYNEAIKNKYRFYSYGDGMLIV
jgi:S-adenosylmethionine:tRNA ribosyltransferase-isomerase